jgi:hypothetical protein
MAAEHCDELIEHAAPAAAGQLDAADVLIMPVAPCAMVSRTTPRTNRLTITAPAATFFIRVFMMHTSFRN